MIGGTSDQNFRDVITWRKHKGVVITWHKHKVISFSPLAPIKGFISSKYMLIQTDDKSYLYISLMTLTTICSCLDRDKSWECNIPIVTKVFKSTPDSKDVELSNSNNTDYTINLMHLLSPNIKVQSYNAHNLQIPSNVAYRFSSHRNSS